MATLRQLRERALLSIDELATACGVTRQAVSAWENGTNRPAMKHIKALVKVLGKTPEEILQAIDESGKVGGALTFA